MSTESEVTRDYLCTAQETPQSDEIRWQLGRIVASAAFRDSLRLTHFLTFVVEATLAGQSDRIKAYTVAVEALGRNSDFDPQTDPIVRVEAGRLRAALARYYGGPGWDDSVVIEVPRGTYVPVFRRQPQQAQAVAIRSSIRGVITAVMDRIRGRPRVLRIVIYIIGILSILEVALDINRPVSCGPNQGLIFQLGAAGDEIAHN